MKIYPAIDIKDGVCARLVQGDMSRSKVYGDPVEMALKWQSEGAEYLHVVDLNAAFAGEFVNKDIVKEIVSNVKIPIEMGGGVRTREDIAVRIEEVGVSRVIIGTMAIEDESLVRWAVEKYKDRIAVGIDAKNGKVRTKGWVTETDIDAVDLAIRMKNLGVRTIIYTDVTRDGMLSGAELPTTTEMVKKTWMNVIASGGVATIDDIVAIRGTGACGVVVGTALYEGTIDFKQAVLASK